MKPTEKDTRKILFIFMASIIAIIVFLTLWKAATNSIPSSEQKVELTTDQKHTKICEEKIIQDFQLINPEFSRNYENKTQENTYIWSVTYSETSEEMRTTEFECEIWWNWTDARILRDTTNNPNADEIIYDNRE